jgi:hypothetical protein
MWIVEDKVDSAGGRFLNQKKQISSVKIEIGVVRFSLSIGEGV